MSINPETDTVAFAIDYYAEVANKIKALEKEAEELKSFLKSTLDIGTHKGINHAVKLYLRSHSSLDRKVLAKMLTPAQLKQATVTTESLVIKVAAT